jgi:protein TonB
MFGEFVEARAGEAGRKSWAMAVSMAVQAAVLMVLLLVPLLYTEALPNFVQNMKSFLAPAVPLVETPKAPAAPVRTGMQPRRIIENGVMHAPRYIPTRVAMIAEVPLPPETPAGAGTVYEGIDLSNLVTEPRAEAPAAPAVPAPAARRIRQTEILPAMILSQPQPAYPVLAKQTGIQGEVVLHAIIDREGRVAQVEVVSGHPLLVKAAMDAVLTWRYRPTMLNGLPVEVETTIRVGFVLAR